jgi:hypothetical protein
MIRIVSGIYHRDDVRSKNTKGDRARSYTYVPKNSKPSKVKRINPAQHVWEMEHGIGSYCTYVDGTKFSDADVLKSMASTDPLILIMGA